MLGFYLIFTFIQCYHTFFKFYSHLTLIIFVLSLFLTPSAFFSNSIVYFPFYLYLTHLTHTLTNSFIFSLHSITLSASLLHSYLGIYPSTVSLTLLSLLLYLFCYRIYHYLFTLYILFLCLYYSVSSPFDSDTFFLTLLFLLSQYAIPSLYLASFMVSVRFVDSPMFVHGSIEGKWFFLNLPLLTMKLCSLCY